MGVARLVCPSDEPTPVSDAIIRGVQLREDTTGLVKLQQRPRFMPGEKIRVRDGAFCDQLGLFEGITDATRVAILIDLLGRKVKVVLDAECVEAT
jgi:transcriptional antiterminator RfaH